MSASGSSSSEDESGPVVATESPGAWLDRNKVAVLSDASERHRVIGLIQERVRDSVQPPRGAGTSIAVLDRTSVHRTITLLEGEDTPTDPFIAFADLATVIGAAIFDDRLVLLGEETWTPEAAAQANELLGLQDAIRAITYNPDRGALEEPDHSLAEIADLLTGPVLDDLIAASESRSEWIGWLRSYWAELLPRVTFPDHDWASLSDVIDRYKYHYDEYDVFNISGDAWAVSSGDPQDLILDNDFRGLFYLRFVDLLATILGSDQHHPSVHYVGGCLRAPVIRAQARLAALSTEQPTASPAAWLQQIWRELEGIRMTQSPILFPFWMDAVLASSSRLSDIGKVVGDLRGHAKPFRRRRNEMTQAVRYGKSKDLGKLIAALHGDAEQLSSELRRRGEAVQKSVGKAAELVPFPLLPTVIDAIPVGTLASIGTKIFRPDLRFVIRLSQDAQQTRRSLTKFVDLFPLSKEARQARATEPSDFLKAVGEIAWMS